MSKMPIDLNQSPPYLPPPPPCPPASFFPSVLVDVFLDVPDKLDLTHLRATGLQPGEEMLPEGERQGGGQPRPCAQPPVVAMASVNLTRTVSRHLARRHWLAVRQGDAQCAMLGSQC